MGDKFELLKTPVNRTVVRKKNKNEKLRLRVIFLDDSERVFEVEVRNHIYTNRGKLSQGGYGNYKIQKLVSIAVVLFAVLN